LLRSVYLLVTLLVPPEDGQNNNTMVIVERPDIMRILVKKTKKCPRYIVLINFSSFPLL